MQRYKKSAKSKTEQVKNLCPSVKSVGKKEKQQRKNLRHLRNLRDKKSPDYFRNRDFDKRRRLPTLPHCIAVPSAQVSLTSLFGMGRGGTSPQ